MANNLSKRLDQVPSWIVQTVVGAALTGLIAWATWATATTSKHETRISVVETRTDNIDKSLTEIKSNQKDQTEMLQKLLIRRSNGH
jgi:septation ring formation regulator EzrA